MYLPVLSLFFNPDAVGINIAVLQSMKSIATPFLNTVFLYLDESFYLVMPLAVLFLYLRKRMDAYSMAVSFVLLFIIGEVLKLVFMEPRPCNDLSLPWINAPSCDSSYSFPSDHATVLTGPLIFLRSSRLATALYGVWLVAVLFGKLYLGQHYLTDIVAGAVVSILVVLVINRYRNWINSLCNGIVARIVPRLAIKPQGVQ